MWATDHGRAPDVTLAHERCDFCGHDHACYVGGSPTYDLQGDVTSWGVYACLGCLMRASVPGAFDRCEGCAVPAGARSEGRSDA